MKVKSRQNLGHGVTLEFMYDGRVVIFTLQEASDSALQTWLEKEASVIHEWPATSAFLVVYDVSAVKFPGDPAHRDMITAMLEDIPVERGRSAVIVPDNHILGTLRLFLNRSTERFGFEIEQEFFTDRDVALRWLAEGYA